MNGKDPHSSEWLKSSHSNGNGNCVEVRFTSVTVAMRDSKQADGPIFTLSPKAFAGLVTFARNADVG
ncbi:DUF397 domain-containing protein [Streptomyces sp. NPDC048290]|uniref:DUF397 domain-containing protein n=1 Tax=Streptomyces sp. NPDC048290 TaxID=3155811 RepID=UPI003439828F